MTAGKVFRGEREQLGLTLDDVARLARCKPQTVRKFEQGHFQPAKALAQRLSASLNGAVSPEVILNLNPTAVRDAADRQAAMRLIDEGRQMVLKGDAKIEEGLQRLGTAA